MFMAKVQFQKIIAKRETVLVFPRYITNENPEQLILVYKRLLIFVLSRIL